MDSLPKSQKVVLITGCSSGLGRALAYAFHGAANKGQRTYQVYATARRLDSIRELAEAGMKVLVLDVTDSASIAACVSAAIKQSGRVDILVNNAGLLIPGPIAEQPLEELQRIFDANVWGAIRMVQQVVPNMAQQRSGLIINIGSVTAMMTTPFGGGYAASKAALHSLTHALAMELAPLGIHTLLVDAGAIKTALAANATRNVTTERYGSATSLYRPAVDAIAARAELSQKDPNLMAAEDVAQQVLAAVHRCPVPRRVRVAGSVWKYVLYGFLQWLLPSWMYGIMQRRFGLDKSW